jgi:transcriptional regulator with XRE-family HTH domain
MKDRERRKKFGEALKKLREERGLTMYAVAKKGGFNRTQVTFVETGDRNYTIDCLMKYCDGCGLSLRIEGSPPDGIERSE